MIDEIGDTQAAEELFEDLLELAFLDGMIDRDQQALAYVGSELI